MENFRLYDENLYGLVIKYSSNLAAKRLTKRRILLDMN